MSGKLLGNVGKGSEGIVGKETKGNVVTGNEVNVGKGTEEGIWGPRFRVPNEEVIFKR